VNKEELLDEVRSLVMRMGFSLLDLRETQQKTERLIRFAIFKAEGVSVGDCARVTLAVRDFILMHHPEEDIRVEVSSPGAERILKSMDDYKLFVMRKVQLTLKSGEVLQLMYKGLDEASSQPVFIQTKAGVDKELIVPLVEIGKCRLVLE
jgi:ribosome maturation factor RimP